MKLGLLLCVCILMRGVLSHMPTVYEFCSHVVASGNVTPGQLTCDSSQCQGIPGKKGPKGTRGVQGVPGINGMKGQKGERGTSEHLDAKVEALELSLNKVTQELHAIPLSFRCYLGMRNRDIDDRAITSSSDYNSDHARHLGRLDNQVGIGAWCARNNRVGEWIQVDLGKPLSVTGVVTQGRPTHPQWVKSYKISCGTSTNAMAVIRENGVDKVFGANSDQNTKVFRKFPGPQTCRYVRLHPQSWHRHISMRMEIIRGSCFDLY